MTAHWHKQNYLVSVMVHVPTLLVASGLENATIGCSRTSGRDFVNPWIQVESVVIVRPVTPKLIFPQKSILLVSFQRKIYDLSLKTFYKTKVHCNTSVLKKNMHIFLYTCNTFITPKLIFSTVKYLTSLFSKKDMWLKFESIL